MEVCFFERDNFEFLNAFDQDELKDFISDRSSWQLNLILPIQLRVFHGGPFKF